MVGDDFDAMLEGVDAVMMLRLQRERMEEGLVPSLEDYHARYGLTAQRLRRAAADAAVLHPGPINRGVEITDEVADGPQSWVLRQVANGVAVAIAVATAVAILAWSRRDHAQATLDTPDTAEELELVLVSAPAGE